MGGGGGEEAFGGWSVVSKQESAAVWAQSACLFWASHFAWRQVGSSPYTRPHPQPA